MQHRERFFIIIKKILLKMLKNSNTWKRLKKTRYGVKRKIINFNLPVNCQVDLFDKVVLPDLLYGCEICVSNLS